MNIAPVTHYLTQSPTISAASHDRKALMWSIAAKVTLAVLAAISTVALTIAILGSSLLAGPLPAITLGLILSTPLLMHASKDFAARSTQHRNQAAIEHGVAEKLKEIASWQDGEIETFCNRHRIDKANFLPERLPLVARFYFWEQKAQEHALAACQHLFDDCEGSHLAKLKVPEHSREKVQIDQLRYQLREAGHAILEGEVLSAKLKSALLLELIANPFQELELGYIGNSYPKPLGQRYCERLMDHCDTYFEFNDPNRNPLNATEIWKQDAADLRQGMFA